MSRLILRGSLYPCLLYTSTLGGQTAVNLAAPLARRGVKIIGTDCDAIERAENRDAFDAVIKSLGIPNPKGEAVTDIETGAAVAARIGYPVLVRPSFVLGGRAMEIVANETMLRKYLKNAVEVDEDKPVLIDKYLMGKEVEIDAICDGSEVFIPGIMEQMCIRDRLWASRIRESTPLWAMPRRREYPTEWAS